MNDRFYAVQMMKDSADIFIFGDICEEQWFEEDVTPTNLIAQIRDMDVPEIRVHINSYGGSVSAGWAIYSALRESKARIVTYADGFVASAANYPFLAGDERHASAVSAFFLHNVSTFAGGYAEDLRKAADDIEKMTEIGINAFVERAGMDRETVAKLMDEETWLTPEEALAYGIATDIDSEREQAVNQNARKAVLQMIFKSRREIARPEEQHTTEPVQAEEEPEAEEENKENPVQSEEEPAADIQPVKSLMQTLTGIFNAKN